MEGADKQLDSTGDQSSHRLCRKLLIFNLINQNHQMQMILIIDKIAQFQITRAYFGRVGGGLFRFLDWQPIGGRCLLLFEGTLEGLQDIGKSEGANSGSFYAVSGGERKNKVR